MHPIVTKSVACTLVATVGVVQLVHEGKIDFPQAAAVLSTGDTGSVPAQTTWLDTTNDNVYVAEPLRRLGGVTQRST